MRATIAKTITIEPKTESVVAKVRPMDEKFKKSPIRAVIAKLNPMEKWILSIMSRVTFLGNSVSVKQYPGRRAERIKPKT